MQKKIESPYIDSGKIASAAAILLICQVVLGSVSLMFYLVNRPDFRAYMQSDPFFLIFVYFQLSMAVTLWMKKRGLLLTLALAGYVGILLLMVVYSTFRSGMYFIRMLNEIGPRIYKDTFLFFNFLSQFASIFRYIVLFFYTIRLSLRDGDMRAEKSRRRWIVPGLLTAFNNFLGMIGLIYHELYTVGGRVFSLVNISGILNSTAFLIAIFFLCYYVAYPHRMK